MSEYLRNLMGQVVIAYTHGSDVDSPPEFTGVMVGYYDHPTALVDIGDGLHPHAWSGNLVKAADRSQEVEFWRKRALEAEEKLRRV